jgi:hypothetical protein
MVSSVILGVSMEAMRKNVTVIVAVVAQSPSNLRNQPHVPPPHHHLPESSRKKFQQQLLIRGNKNQHQPVTMKTAIKKPMSNPCVLKNSDAQVVKIMLTTLQTRETMSRITWRRRLLVL